MLLELILGQGLHVFSRQPQGRIEQASLGGVSLVGWFGQEYLIVDRAFVGIARAARRLARNSVDHSLPGQARVSVSNPERASTARLVSWGIRRATCAISEWLEPQSWIYPPPASELLLVLWHDWWQLEQRVIKFSSASSPSRLRH